MSEPTRWSKDPLARPPAAELLLRGARRPRPPGTDELARLGSVVAHIPRRAALSARRRSRLVVAAAAAAVVASLGTAVWALRARRPSEPVAGAVVWAAVRPALVPAPVVVAPPTEIPGDRPTPKPSVRRRNVAPPDVSPAAQRERPAPAVVVAAASADSLVLEIALIDAARADLDAAPARALAALEAHRRQFPRGQLAAEREFLAVESLRRLDRLDEARRRAADLQISYPSSSYAARAVRLLQSP
jgi:hypothetical protein